MPPHIKTGRLKGLPAEMRRTLAAARKTRGWSQAELGRRVGLPQMHISRIEGGKTSPHLTTLLDLVRVLGYDLLLVPRTLVPATQAMIRDHESPDTGDTAEDERPLYGGDENEDEERGDAL